MVTHSMFPTHWDEARIHSEITSAWRNNKVKTISGDVWESRSKSGVLIRGYIRPNKTAFQFLTNEKIESDLIYGKN